MILLMQSDVVQDYWSGARSAYSSQFVAEIDDIIDGLTVKTNVRLWPKADIG